MDRTQPSTTQRVDKRPVPHTTNEASKRRAPYVSRACDACRRRKGRCDGGKPCEYCIGRSLECKFSSCVDERRSNTGLGSGHPQQPQIRLVQQLQDQWRDSGANPDALQSLSTLVIGLQDQLNALAAFMKPPTSDPPQIQYENHSAFVQSVSQPVLHVSEAVHPPMQTSRSVSDASCLPAANSALKRSPRPFYGPTSPEYSLNAAKITMSQEKPRAPAPNLQQDIPSLNEDLSDDEDQSTIVVDGSDGSSTCADGSNPQQLPRGLLRFCDVLSKNEASRLLKVYQEIIGELHPICDIEQLAKQLDRWYGWSPGIRAESGSSMSNDTTQEIDHLLILCLALSIALSAESVSQSEVGRDLYDGFKDIAQAKLVAPVTTEKDVTVTLMMGFYDYFNGRLRMAWRMCGLAGRMAMQLGIHNREVIQRSENDGRLAEISMITASLVVLDRQWSAAAGLPDNFQISNFHTPQLSATRTPYLKAMMSFTLMSHRFNEPISRVARGEAFDDDDSLEVTVLQIEQWRQRTLDKQKFTHPLVWETTPSRKSPSWMTMLYLRANAVRIILLRPFFLSAPNRVAKKHIRSGLELITDSISILSILDRTTDTYRKQHPQFQHFLASACALLFLIVAHAEKNRLTSSTETCLPLDYAESVRQNFRKALTLSAAYRESSCASRRLWKRLIALREPLARLDIFSREETPSNARNITKTAETDVNNQAATHFAPAVINNGGKEQNETYKPANGQPGSIPGYSQDDLSLLDLSQFDLPDETSPIEGDEPNGTEFWANLGMSDSLCLDWVSGDGGTFFSDSGL